MTPEPLDDELLAGRWALGRRLGAGSFGVVYEARDIETGETIGLKVLRFETPTDARHLKREFRTLRDLAHPNLVPLRELVVDSGRCFFTMDLVAGVDLGAIIAAHHADPAFEPALRAIFADIATGLAFLHAQGVLHRDLKPANVMVTPAGRAIILDFGLASHMGREASHASRAGTFTGTPVYAAPEQLAGDAQGPASDCYSLGVMLHLALTGRLPETSPYLFTYRLPADPRSVRPEVSVELGELTCALLAPRPEDRPSATEVVTRLADAALPRAPPEQPSTFVGREAALATLADWSKGARPGARLFLVTGDAGIGKSALIEHFASERQRAGDLVLRGRCHIHERIPFNAVDGVVDDLVRFLRRVGVAGVMHLVRPTALVAMFPVFEEIFGHFAGRSGPSIDEQDAAFDALADIVGWVATTRRVLVAIDDLQWADSDSERVVRRLVAAKIERVSIVGTWRPEGGDATVRPGDAASLRLEPLEPNERVLLARSLVARAGLPPDDAARIASAGLGHPLLTQLVASHAGAQPETSKMDVAGAVRAIAVDLTPEERDLVVLVAASTGVSRRILHSAWNHATALEPLCEGLVARRLLRLTLRDGEWGLVPYHGLVREALLGLVDAAGLRSVHARLASAHEAATLRDTSALVHHELQAGHLERAVVHAERGAERAASGMAFGRAAELLEVALGLATEPGERVRLALLFGDALIKDGRGIEAGRAILAAIEEAPSPEPGWLVDQLCVAAEHLLRGGDRELGVTTMRRALDLAGIAWRRSTGSALFSLLRNRLALGLVRRFARSAVRADVEIDPRHGKRLMVMWSAGVGLSFYEPLRAFDFQARHALLATRLGARRDLALAHSTEAMILALRAGPAASTQITAHQARAEALIDRAHEPEVEAHLRFMGAAFAYSEWRFELVIERARDGVAFCRERCPGAQWERASLAWLETSALGQIGRYATQRVAVDAAMAAARRVGDRFSEVMLDMGPSTLHRLAADDADLAGAAAEAALPLAGASGYLLYQYAFTAVRVLLYRGEHEAAWSEAEARWSAVRRLGMGGLALVRLEMLELVGMSALAVGLATGKRDALRRARAAAKRLVADDHPASQSKGYLLLGQLARAEHRKGDADQALRRSALGFDALRIPAASLVARALTEDGGGVDGALRGLADLGAVRPERFVATLAPIVALCD